MKKIVTLQCNSHRVALTMVLGKYTITPIRYNRNSNDERAISFIVVDLMGVDKEDVAVRNWGHLESWKSSASR